MRITVECGAFDEAADAVRTANQVCAIAAEALSARLIRSGGMAGNDSTSAEFAAAYDAGAREAVHALASLSSALVGLGRLVAATGQRHRRAEASAAGEVLGSVSAALASEAWTRSDLPDPPSSLGAQEPSLGQVDRWILDHVEGFVWPGADVDALRGMATSWRRASESVAGLSDHLTAARALLATQRSPELVTALACIDDMDTMIIDTAAELAALGSACDEHASAVEEVHHRTRALLTEVASMAVEGVAISVILTGLSGGLGGGVGLGTLLARLRTVAPRFHALLASLRVSVAVSASRLRTGRETLSGLRVRLERYARAQVRDERGSVGWGRGRPPVPGRPRPEVDDPKLKNYVHQIFKGVDNPRRTGDGTTMDAIRQEINGGALVNGKDHVGKGREILRGLERWLRNNVDASLHDRAVARDLIRELQELLK